MNALDHQADDILKEDGAGLLQIHIQKPGKAEGNLPEVVENEGHEDADLQQPLKGLDHTAQGKQPLKALKGADPAEFWPDGLPGHQHFGLEKGHAHSQQDGHGQKGAGHSDKRQGIGLRQLLEQIGNP